MFEQSSCVISRWRCKALLHFGRLGDSLLSRGPWFVSSETTTRLACSHVMWPLYSPPKRIKASSYCVPEEVAEETELSVDCGIGARIVVTRILFYCLYGNSRDDRPSHN
jgi:hypothetical protein